MVDYNLITEEEWDALAPVKQPDAWDQLLDELEQGRIVRLPVADEKALRGTRLTLGRRAAKRGFKVDIRTQDTALAVRKREEAPTPPEVAETAPVPRRRGRKPKEAGPVSLPPDV